MHMLRCISAFGVLHRRTHTFPTKILCLQFTNGRVFQHKLNTHATHMIRVQTQHKTRGVLGTAKTAVASRIHRSQKRAYAQFN